MEVFSLSLCEDALSTLGIGAPFGGNAELCCKVVLLYSVLGWLMAERSAPTFRNYSGLWTESCAVCKTTITSLRLFRATEPKHLSLSLVFESPWRAAAVQISSDSPALWRIHLLQHSHRVLWGVFFTFRPHKFKKQKLYSGVQQPCFFFFIIYVCF